MRHGIADYVAVLVSSYACATASDYLMLHASRLCYRSAFEYSEGGIVGANEGRRNTFADPSRGYF